MVGRPLTRVRVVEPSQVAEARRTATQVASSLGFPAAGVGTVALVATELATNLVKHGESGELLVGETSGAGEGLDLVAVDAGRGMRDVARCLEDGYSTAGSPGTGLGAVVRKSALFDVHTQPGGGTAILARCLPSGARASAVSRVLGAITTAKEGQVVCGDAWAAVALAGVRRVMVVDGLGHGPAAHDAANAAQDLLHAHADLPLPELVLMLHEGLRHTRGAALAVADINLAARTVTYAGLGNIIGSIAWAGGRRHMVSMNGTAGHSLTRVRSFDYELPSPSFVVLHSDGLKTQWDLATYGATLERHPSVVAALLWRDLRRMNDDATVLVYKVPGDEEG